MDIKEALECGQFSEDVYGPGDFIDIKDLRVGIRGLIIAFRGTANTRNALRDVTVMPPSGLDGFWVHRGFAAAFRELTTILDPVVRGLPVGSITFTGHSFGAAVAVLAAAHYRQRAVTFGCPAAHFWFAPRPPMDHVRIICDDDPVPKVPFLTGRHTCPPSLVLKDKDHQWIDVEDHSIKEYNKRLRAWAAHQQ